MRQPVVITGPITTPEESARNYGIPMRRAKELIRMVEESIDRKAKRRSGAKSRSVTVEARTNGKAGAKPRKSSRKKAARAKARKS